MSNNQFSFNQEEQIKVIVRKEVREEVSLQLTGFRSEIISKFDQVLGELIKIREETIILSHHSSKHSDDIAKLKSIVS